MASDAGRATVAPAGGREAVLSTNPIAAGFPTESDPVLIDISTAAVSEGQAKRARSRGERLAGPWVIDTGGLLSDNPEAMEKGGAILPLGDAAAGHKGFALGLLVEALTAGLSGYGRADCPEPESCSFFLQLSNPKLFGGSEAFMRQMSWVAATCRRSVPRPGGDQVRLPGERALANRRKALQDGLFLELSLEAPLTRLSDRYGVPFPSPDPD
jgi:L-lactate dehydrogenase